MSEEIVTIKVESIELQFVYTMSNSTCRWDCTAGVDRTVVLAADRLAPENIVVVNLVANVKTGIRS